MRGAAVRGDGTHAMWAGGHPWLQPAPEFAAPQVFNDAKHGADLFSLKAFGNIYSRIMVRSRCPGAKQCTTHC